MSEPRAVVVADDHPLFRKGVLEVLESEPLRVVGEADDGEAALALLRQHRPDLAILDLDMPRKGGIEVANAIRKEGLPTTVIILTMHRSPAMLSAALDAGVRGYVSKDRAADDLVACINLVLGGGTYVSPGIASMPAPRSSQIAHGAARYGRDLSALAIKGAVGTVVGVDATLEEVTRVLLQSRKNNPLLVGEPGVGKTAIVEALAVRLRKPESPPVLRSLRLVEVSMGALVAGTRFRGDFEERVQSLIDEANADPNLLLFIDEIHLLMGAGSGEGALDAANLLKPALANGSLRLIGATTTAEYRKYFENDAALQRRFQIVWVDEPTAETAVMILQALRRNLEEHHQARITDAALERAVQWSVRYLPEYRLPDKALDIIDQACTRGVLAAFARAADQRPVIDVPEVAAAISARSKVPVEQITEREAEGLLHLERTLSRRLVGQERAVTAVASAIRAAKAGIGDPRRPIGVFLFVGPTGTGKTELAKALAAELFDDERSLIRVDMSEYAEKHSIARLIGSPPGYVGHAEGGHLTEAVRNRPYSVIVFDEIEKAHPDVFDVFLQIFDEGELTDGRGRRASFRNTVIILTSNAGTRVSDEPRRIGFAGVNTPQPAPVVNSSEQDVRAAVAEVLRPELLNRLTEIVVFSALDRPALEQILELQIERVRQRVAESGVELEVTQRARQLLLERGSSDRFGARELERTIDRMLVQPLAARILQRGFARERVRADATNGELVLSSAVSVT